MKFDAILIPARRAQMIAAGLWHDRTINDELDACLAQCPDKLARWQSFGVTQEPAGGSNGPTGPRVLGGSI